MAMGSFAAAQYQVLEQVATGAPLSEVLDAIVRLIEARGSGLLCTILLLDERERTLNHGAAPSLPRAYIDALDGAVIGPKVGSCGAAAYFGKRVVVEDIATDPLWEDYRDLALQNGLRACWSTPIESSERAVLGTFAIYYREIRGPAPEELEWVAEATQLAAVAIVRDRAEQSLRASEARARQLARLYAVSNAVNEAIVRVREPEQLYELACRIAVEKGLARLAWVGHYDETEDRIVPLARFGADEGYVAAISLRLRDPRARPGPSAKAMRSGRPSVSNDVDADPDFNFKEDALARGLRSCAVFPLQSGGRTAGILAIYGHRTDFFRDEEVQVLSALAEDISFAVESAQVERELRRSEALLRLAGQVAKLGGWSLELPALRLNWSDEVCVIHGVPPGTEPNLDKALDYYAPEFRDLIQRSLDDCIRSGTPYDIEAQIVSAEGGRVWVRTNGRAERDASGAITRVHGAIQDIGERRELEHQLRHAQKMEAVGQLAGGVAHDFNNLLTVILSYAALLLDTLEPSSPLYTEVAQIAQAGERAEQLTRQLLAFSRQQVLQPRLLDLNTVVTDLESMVSRLVGRDIEVAVVTTPDLGRVLADPGQIEQVLMNLVVNARDAMPDGGALRLETANAELDATYADAHPGVVPGSYVEVAVSDTGVGMGDETRGRIFEPFYTTKAIGKGTGLGLSTVWGIVTQSGGHVSVSSTAGTGSTFRVYFPRVDREAAVVEVQRSARPARTGGSETVLVVEDERQVRTLLERILSSHGYTVLSAPSPGDALLIGERHVGPIELLLTDVTMPRMSGRELAGRFLAMRPDTRVLYLSGYPERSMVQGGGLEPGIALLSKPFTSEVLLRKVREVLDGPALTGGKRLVT